MAVFANYEVILGKSLYCFVYNYLILCSVMSGVSPSQSRLLTRSYSPFTLHPCRWTNHPHRVLKRFIETKVPPGSPDAVMAQTGMEKKKKCSGMYLLATYVVIVLSKVF
jgi:hypothetical protein